MSRVYRCHGEKKILMLFLLKILGGKNRKSKNQRREREQSAGRQAAIPEAIKCHGERLVADVSRGGGAPHSHFEPGTQREATRGTGTAEGNYPPLTYAFDGSWRRFDAADASLPPVKRKQNGPGPAGSTDRHTRIALLNGFSRWEKVWAFFPFSGDIFFRT